MAKKADKKHKKQRAMVSSQSSHLPASFFVADTRPVRQAGIIARYIDPNEVWFYNIQQRDDGCQAHLSALFLWYLCDGQHTLTEIYQAASEHYGLSLTTAADSVDGVLAEFFAKGFLLLYNATSVQSFLHLGHVGLPAEYINSEHYFIATLARHCNLIINPPTADLLLVAADLNSPAALPNDSSQAYTIGLALLGAEDNPAADSYDQTIGPLAGGERHTTMLPEHYLSLQAENWPHESDSAAWMQALEMPAATELPHASPPKPRSASETEPRLTIGMAVVDDFDGVYFTVQALRYYHQEVADSLEIIVLDNNPDGPFSEAIENFMRSLGSQGRYIPCRQYQSTAVRDYVFYYARGEYVMCIDSHVLVEPGGLKALIGFLDAHPDCMDLIQGPLLYDDLQNYSSHFDPIWREGMLGIWGSDHRANDLSGEEFDIPAQGLALFACRKSAWLGFNQRFRGFGGEECYIHAKFHKAGRRTLCLPALRWVHRFHHAGRALNYPNIIEQRICNYFHAFDELGLDSSVVEDHFIQNNGMPVVTSAHQMWTALQQNPFIYFDNIYCITSTHTPERWEAMQRRFAALGITNLVVRHEAVWSADDNHHIGCALSHREIFAHADYRGFERILIVEDDALFLDATLMYLRRMIAELDTLAWRRFFLGACRWEMQHPKAPGCRYIDKVTQDENGLPAVTCSHAVAYSKAGYQEMLELLPDTEASMRQWLDIHSGFDQILGKLPENYLASPMLCTQPNIRNIEEEGIRDSFTIGD